MISLINKVTIITEAGSGISRAAAKLFAQEGAKVIVGARLENELNMLVEEIKKMVDTSILVDAGVSTSKT